MAKECLCQADLITAAVCPSFVSEERLPGRRQGQSTFACVCVCVCVRARESDLY